jgi:O-antigen ligase
MAVQERRYSAERPVAAARRLVAANPALAPCLLTVIAIVALAASDGGFYPTAWYAAGLFFLGLLAVTLLALGRPRGLPWPAVAALALFAAYTAWTYCSIAWADDQGAAWDGANRTATYLVVLALFALWPAERRGATLLLGALGLGIAGLGLVELLRANASATPADWFVGARLAGPAGYINANVAMWTVALFPCVFLATRRELPAPLRGASLAGAGVLASLALMGQSRGWALALPLGVVFYLVLVPGRIRSLLALAAVAAGTLAVSGPVLAVHDELTPGGLDELLADATVAILTMAIVLFFAGTAAALVDRGLKPESRPARLASRAITGLAAVAAVAALAIALASDPVDRVSDAWGEFKQGEDEADVGASRFGTAGTNRYDFWSVAWEVFREKPLRGVGVENFQAEYLRRGESFEQPRYAHSLELGVLAQTGLVGALLLAAALLAALVAAALALRRLPGAAERACAAAAVAVFAYWLLHASVDWLWEFPAVTVPALAMLGLAGALAPREKRAEPATTTWSRIAPALVVAPALLALGVSLALPWLAERHIARAADTWRTEPEAALERLDRAAALNPLATRAQLTEATIALRLDRIPRAERALREALERQPDNAYALLELGLIAASRGDRREARALLRRTLESNPRDVVVREVLGELRRGRRIDLEEVNDEIVTRARGVATTPD